VEKEVVSNNVGGRFGNIGIMISLIVIIVGLLMILKFLSWYSLKLELGLSLDIRQLVILFQIGVYAVCNA